MITPLQLRTFPHTTAARTVFASQPGLVLWVLAWSKSPGDDEHKEPKTLRLPSLQIFHKRPHLGNQGSGTPALLDGLAGALPVVIAAVICALWSTAALGSTVEPAPRLAPHPG